MKRNLNLLIGLLAWQFVATAQNSSTPVKSNTQPVTWQNYTRAETHVTFANYVKLGAFGKFFHLRQLTPIDKQDIVRMNRDTRYSMGIFDLTQPLTIDIPESNGRYIAIQVINEDEYTKTVLYAPGKHTLTQEKIGTRYVCLLARILVNPEDAKDNLMVTELQNKLTASQADTGKFEIPNWDEASLIKLRDAVKVIASTLTDTKLCFGDVNEVNPIAHLLGAAAGWGGNPPSAAIYVNHVPAKNDGKTPHTITVKDVPVDGFWSISLYNKAGFFEKNTLNAYSINNYTAKKEKDGSIVIHFGGDPNQYNYLPIMDGWNYIVRLYRPRKEIQNGSWKFPDAVELK